MTKTSSTAFIRLTFLNADDGPQDSLRTCYRTSSSCPIKDSQGHDNSNPQVAFLVAVRFVSLLPSSATEKINEGATIRRAGRAKCLAGCAPRCSWVTRPGSFGRPDNGAKCFCHSHGLLAMTLATAWAPPYLSEHDCNSLSAFWALKIGISVVCCHK